MKSMVVKRCGIVESAREMENICHSILKKQLSCKSVDYCFY